MALIAASWLTVADVKAEIAEAFRFTRRADAGSWVPTSEQTEKIEDALSKSYDFWRQYWAGSAQNISPDDLDTWDMRETMQKAVMFCELGKIETWTEDTGNRPEVDLLCESAADYIESDPTAYGADGKTPLGDNPQDKHARRQVRYTYRDGLDGADHDREVSVDAGTGTRTGKLPLAPAGSGNTRRS